MFLKLAAKFDQFLLLMLSNLFKPTRTLFISLHSNTHTNNIHVFSPQFPTTLQLQQPSHSLRLINNNKPEMPKPKMIAEYAKSARSSCKTCSDKIPDKALRLGLVSKDPRGYDSTKWFHLHCFSNSIDSVDVIQGFDSLKESDKETLKKLVDESKSSAQNSKREFENEEVVELQKGKLKKSKKSQEESDQEGELEENDAKKTKLSLASEEAKLDIKFSPSDCKDKYKDAKLMPKWKACQTIIFLERDDGLHDSSKIAAFDFDGCLAKTSVKRVGADAWSLMHSSIPNKLQCLYNDGYKLVIFTNESNIDRWKNKRQVAVDSKIGRLNNFISRVEVPIQVFIACGYSDGKVEDPFRKPKPGMWQIMEKHFNSGIPIDMDQSFYVGDAAGRPQDHSDADKKFAEAIGLKFFVPEDYFGF